jgi:hypothetical protein
MLTAEILDQLRDILRDEFDVECTREEANAIARDLLGFFDFLIHENKQNEKDNTKRR